VRTGPGAWHCLGRPEYLRQCVEMSLRRLRLDRIELYQLHRIDPQVPLVEQLGVLDDMRSEGKIRHLGLSEVSVAEVAQARLIAPIASVQSGYSLLNRRHEKVLDYCAGNGLAFICSSPVDGGELARSPGPLAAIAQQAGCTPVQVALAWLLRRSPALLPIPGTASVTHVRENAGARDIVLSADQYAALAGLIGAHWPG
jgi:pyridoxine 4-dehydrogenase